MALKFEQDRWRNLGILPGRIIEEYKFSKYDPGERIAQIWMESADNQCRPDEIEAGDFVFKFKVGGFVAY